MAEKKYLPPSLLTRGWSPAMLTDPYLAKPFAAGVTAALTDNIAYAAGAPAVAPPQVSPNPPAEWIAQYLPSSVNNALYAFPSMTYMELKTHIQDIFTLRGKNEATQREIKGIVAAYGLHCDPAVAELNRAAESGLAARLSEHPEWAPDTPVAAYWPTYQFLFPAITAILNRYFSHPLVATTVVEQFFSVSRTVVHSNSSNSTVQRDLNFAMNAKQAIISDMRYTDGDEDDNTQEEQTVQPAKQLRNKLSTVQYLQFLFCWGKHLQEESSGDSVPSCRQIDGIGKRKADLLSTMPYVEQEFALNELAPHKAFDCVDLQQKTQEFTDTYLAGKTAFSKPVLSSLEAASKASYWTAAKVREYLKTADPVQYSEVDTVKVRPGKNDDKHTYVTLSMLLTEYWEQNNITVEDINAIVNNNAESEI